MPKREPDWTIACSGTDSAVLMDGPGFDFLGLVRIDDDKLVLRRRGDEDENETKVPLALVRELLASHGVKDC